MDPIKCAGYTIPAGWTIMVVPAALQLNPNTFVDPLAFNPWRWKVYITFFLNISFSIWWDDPLLSNQNDGMYIIYTNLMKCLGVIWMHF